MKGTQSHVELAEDPTFTVFAGELPDFGTNNDAEAALDAEFGVVEPVSDDADFSLDLSDTGLAEDENADFALDTDFAEGSDAEYGESQESSISSGLGTDVGPNDFELDLSEAIAEQIMASSIPTPTDSLDIGDEIAEDELDLDVDVEAGDDLDLDIDLEPALGEEAEISLDIDDVGVDLDNVEETDSADTVEVAEGDLDLGLDIGTEDDEPQLILDDEEPALELSEEPEVSLDLDTGGDDEIAFSLDDAAESVETTETAEPAEEKADDDEGGIDFGGLEMEETPDKDK